MGKLKESKGLYVFLSIVLAICLWAYVRVVDDPEVDVRLNNLPIVLTSEDVLESRGLMVNEVTPESVSITFHGANSAISELKRNRPSLSVDLSRITSEGEYSLTYTINYPGSVSASGITNKREITTVTVTVVPLATKELEVEGTFVGEVADGFQAGELSITPEMVTISGEESAIRRVARAVVEVGGENLTKTYEGELPVTLLDTEGKPITDGSVRCSDNSVFVTLPVVVVKEVPLTVNLIPGGGILEQEIDQYVRVDIKPETIVISGEAEDVEPTTEISLGDIDLSKIFTTETFEIPIELTSELTNTSGVTKAIVTVTIQGLEMRTVSVDNIDLQNVSSGYRASVVTQSLDVQLRGPVESLEQISASQLRVVGDLTDIVSATGRYTVPAKVYLDGPEEVGIVGEYTIVVQVTR